MDASSHSSQEKLEVLRSRLLKDLKGFTPEFPRGVREWDLAIHKPSPEQFPVPELVLFALRDVLGFRALGVGEKVRWTVLATIDGEPAAFSLQKFGFRILIWPDAPEKFVSRITGQLSCALKHLNDFLQDFAICQVENGNLTMANRIGSFDNRYRYFRQLADDAFASMPPPASSSQGANDVGRDISDRINFGLRKEERGFFASAAMIDAYFSLLEHRLLLLRAFSGEPLAKGGFKSFLESRWDERLTELLGAHIHGRPGKLLGRLRDVKATLRNPLAHGGVENDGGAFYFHLPRIGAVPANLSRYRGRLQTSFFPISRSTHQETAALFDEVDALLTEGPFELPNKFVKWGVDPQFDAHSIGNYVEAVQEGADAVETLIQRLSYEWEQHVNMDY